MASVIRWWVMAKEGLVAQRNTSFSQSVHAVIVDTDRSQQPRSFSKRKTPTYEVSQTEGYVLKNYTEVVNQWGANTVNFIDRCPTPQEQDHFNIFE